MAGAVKSLLGSLSRVATPSHGAAAAAAVAARMSQAWTPLVTSVRHRYHWQKMEKGPLLRNYGQNEVLHNKGN